MDAYETRFLSRIKAVKSASQNALNPEFKELWANINKKLIKNERARIADMRGREKKYYDSIQ